MHSSVAVKNVRRVLCVFPAYTPSFGTFAHAYKLMQGVRARGVDVHIGSQLTQKRPLQTAMARVGGTLNVANGRPCGVVVIARAAAGTR